MSVPRLLAVEGDDGFFHLIPNIDTSRLGGCISGTFVSDMRFSIHLAEYTSIEDMAYSPPPFPGTFECRGLRSSSKFPHGWDPSDYFVDFFRLNTLLHRYSNRGPGLRESIFYAITHLADSSANLHAKARCLLACHPSFVTKAHIESYQRRVVQVLQHTYFVPVQNVASHPN